MLIGVYLLIPVLREVAKNKTLLRYSLLLWGALIIINPFLEKYYIPQFSLLFKMNIILGYAGYFLLGFFLSSFPLTKVQCKVVYLLGLTGWGITIIGSILSSLQQGSSSSRFLFEVSPHVAMTTASLFLLARELHPKTESIRFERFKSLYNDLFGIYLVHVIWLWVFDRSLIRDIGNQAVTIPLISFFIFICSLLSTRLFRSIPFLRHVI